MLRSKILVGFSRSYSRAAKHVKPGLVPAPKEGSCGIPPWDPQLEPPPRPHLPELPTNLIRPPCMPGSKPGGFQTCLGGNWGFYCPPCRVKYKYPPFSENIDFVPPATQSPLCWWKHPPSCPISDADGEKLSNLTKRWDCNYD
ncbi:hypothetical protein J6590_001812 [Homalodisca vitripennis]|nr:hypothetical protein J6590_100072 [Homalodisca vitripennis]KAG8313346.1 hypothetical protein J6590_001812 [Homalodisca vitripennis]